MQHSVRQAAVKAVIDMQRVSRRVGGCPNLLSAGQV